MINASTDLFVGLHYSLRGPLSVTTFHTFAPHTKWARDPGGSEFDNSQTAWYKQSYGIRRLPKGIADQIAPSLTTLFNKSLPLGIFPEDWKLTNIVPIFKKEKRDFVKNCRHISLLPVISQGLERCVLAGLRNYISQLISREQHSFLSGRSCVSQFTSVLHHIGGQLDAGKQIDIINLDMSEALDKVDITPSYLGGCTNTALLANFTTGFVHIYRDASNRLQRSSFPRIAGYIRGTARVHIRTDIPGPILVLLFVDNLPNAVKTSRVACYADDTKIFKSIDSIKDCNALQSDLNDLVSWSDSSVLIFNQSKCKYQCITPQKTPLRPTSGYTIKVLPLK